MHTMQARLASTNDVYALAEGERHYESQRAMSSPGYLRTFTCIQSSATHVGSHATIELTHLRMAVLIPPPLALFSALRDN